jgi:hypothetical protein
MSNGYIKLITNFNKKHKIKKYSAIIIIILILIRLIIAQTLPINKKIHWYVNNKTNINKLINIF